MMQAKKGIFLTEILIFLLLVALFYVLVMKLIAYSIVSVAEMNKKTDHIAAIISAVDWIIRDIQLVDSLIDSINFEEKGILKILCPTEKITWKLQQDKLLRICQRYDVVLDAWKKPYTSSVCFYILDLQFDGIYSQKFFEKYLKAVSCHLCARIDQNNYYAVHQTIVLRNGLV